ncbi:hypothetical protein H5410_042793 [Solanum commersonii]|uniref:Uncharacterized protein n=1 Tax=Solanum commersonii TaxID=4109 RepID=A0A9J5XXC6_SOLCO|nr:hypothetical protein H5410_042793 [Solanum commersonii]
MKRGSARMTSSYLSKTPTSHECQEKKITRVPARNLHKCRSNGLVPSNLDPQHVWDHCKQISNCTVGQRTIIKDFGVEFMKTFGGLIQRTIAEAVGDWFYDQTGNHQYIDPYL